MNLQRKGGVVFHIGFGTLLLILLVAYILISMSSPDKGTAITNNATQILSAIKPILG